MRQVTRASSGQSQALLSCLIIAVCAALIIQAGQIQGAKAQPGREPGEVNSRQPGNGAYEISTTDTERRLRKVIWKCVSTGNGTTGHRVPRSVFHVRWNPNEKFIVESRENPAINSSKLAPHPRLKVSKNTKLTLSPKLYLCHDKHSELCHNKTQQFRQRIVRAFEKAMVESVNESQANHYNVDYKPVFGDSFEEQYYPSTCLVMEAGVRVLRRKDAPFNKLPFGRLFPRQKLFRNVKDIKTCAIVSSAGSLAGSKLGRFIDTHDIVMRFNHAPTQGHEVDVGSKTTIRVVNSQVVTKPEFDFTRAPIFRNVTIAAWDPGKYNGTLEDWLTSADYDLFTNYELYRRRYPKSRAFLIDPHSVWRLWQSLQMFAGNRPISRNPPSSGFIGLALLLPHCPQVDFVEYVPSTRLNGRCHYYSKEMNSACTFGSWHPLAAEKLMALDMNMAEDDDMSVFQFGILRIRRPDKLLCGFNFFGY
ncbi:beta-galactoside alpha-2,6-sialyltransferase 1 isoform X1 [Drosophila sechellia]|uniref:beta-galactoside alpha-(2,6)-sialyltransferase n=1 Tax=Drosophila sechellia TaxID=7238 RepID=Q0E5A3_DROSE|nr:beta-galactoside alpha-2,6-sialyltransferase 1 isoform X1 [Drosophila sechellia]XP_032572053.1 beta-galactoside alpha-2,6-sialyltransferase 1 isoform X1 [Drosophila sechellia]XP_032572054.1 beta-galactoside alpha-2,6-sialyltransferase 1 isoform X1 [Drosophila sechellia]XP_032572055.1 beta-galactoside alpha-2,6-sialyltransferase 1 isoform X1 [Drosophila sechellia]XP_032572056.1 beta-galactoside alpha-2,6-sialyltransferase 1 isoform X1 [Drosophila sechellia]CAL44598.1 beta-galactosidase alpha